jgi:membrane-associated PAP2 superfamily phosphatase
LLALLVCAWRAPPTTAGLSAGTPTWSSSAPSRGERWWWWAVTVVCLLLVPAMKQASNTSCPWDLAAFGGQATWVSHWRFAVSDGGPGRCFPSGHAVGAFAFLTQYFLWRRHDRRRARLWLWWVLTVGAVFGLGQLARGAHHASHSAWSAWLCAALAALANQLWAWRHAARQRTARC